MKMRILTALDEIANGLAWEKGEYKNLFPELNMDKETTRSAAKQLQTLILHNYDEFAVSTIDAFVHRIIRTFATDVKLPQNFEVVIDRDDIVPDIVAELFDKVGSDKALTDIMINFVLSQAEEEKSFDPGKPVREFVEKQFNEDSFQWLQKIEDIEPAEMLKIIRQIREKYSTLKGTIKNIAGEAVNLISRNNLYESDFYRGRNGISAYFHKCSVLKDDSNVNPNSYINTTISEDKWISGKADATAKRSIGKIKGELTKSFQKIQQIKDDYLLFKTVFKKIYALALASEIRSLFEEYTFRTQKVHISEFNKRISSEIAGQPVPFIYERLGRRYRYFLIDEFQDTSVLQWHNLLPLIEESLANGYFNMLVGDAKQAIYRFRNGEVELFTSLPGIYGNDGSALMKQREQQLKAAHRIKLIKENWRSREEIIRFNNRFFEIIKNGDNNRIKAIYKDHEQVVPLTKKNVDGGYVSIEFIQADNANDYRQKRLDYILKDVRRLKENSYNNRDICVLSNTNSDAGRVASFLLENGIPVISPESLLLENSAAVRLVVALLKLLLNPSLSIVLAEVAQNLKLVTDTLENPDVFFKSFTGLANPDIDKVFEKTGLRLDAGNALNKPVYEIVEMMIRGLELNKEVNIYLQYLLDFVFDAHEKGFSTVSSFLELWEEKKSKAFITLNPEEDAVQVMTIHKAKGLKFETVIVDITGGSNRNTKNEVWTEINLPGINELKVALLPTDRSVANAGFENIYLEEKDKTELDFINMLYVAFTRTVSALFLPGYEGGKNKFSKKLKTFLEAENLYNEDRSEYDFGVLPEKVQGSLKDKKEKEENKINLTKMISSSWDDLIKVARTDEVYWEAIDSKPARTYGKLVHAMLAEIYFAEDIPKVVNAWRFAGIIDEKESEEVSKLLNSIVTHEKLNSFFSRGVIVKNETELIDLDEKTKNKKFRRPDRVVIKDGGLVIIDYKTGEKLPEHVRQVNQYAHVFEKLGFSAIEKKLVYLGDDVEVMDVPS